MNARVERKSFDFIAEAETLRPLRDQIIVKVLPLKLSDVVIAEWKGSAVRGTVVAAGPGRYPNRYATGRKDGKDYRIMRESAHFRPTEVKVGDVVELGGLDIGGYLFTRLQINGEEHILCSEQDVAIVYG
jgi:co-chaperonin GroES (HSP10)